LSPCCSTLKHYSDGYLRSSRSHNFSLSPPRARGGSGLVLPARGTTWKPSLVCPARSPYSLLCFDLMVIGSLLLCRCDFVPVGDSRPFAPPPPSFPFLFPFLLPFRSTTPFFPTFSWAPSDTGQQMFFPFFFFPRVGFFPDCNHNRVFLGVGKFPQTPLPTPLPLMPIWLCSCPPQTRGSPLFPQCRVVSSRRSF